MQLILTKPFLESHLNLILPQRRPTKGRWDQKSLHGGLLKKTLIVNGFDLTYLFLIGLYDIFCETADDNCPVSKGTDLYLIYILTRGLNGQAKQDN